LPNQWLCWLLEKTNTFFIATSSHADSSWLVGIRQLPLPLLFAIPLLGLWIIITPRLQRQGLRALALAAALIVIFSSAYFTTSSYLGECSSGGKNKTTVIAYADHTLAVFDYGALNSTFRYRTWWDYTLMPQVTKKTGKTTIDYLICLQPSERTLEGIRMITNITPIHHVVIVLSPATESSFKKHLDSLMIELTTQNISCAIHILEKQENPPSLANKRADTSEALTPCTPCSGEPNKKGVESLHLTKKISFAVHTNTLNGKITGETITCDKQILTLGAPAEPETLLTPASDLDKQPHAL
jgi:hypothetical protein